MNRRRHAFSVPGISLLVLIFLSLSLITFSLLSLSGASADESLSQKAADRTTVYYQASNTANELLASIDTCLADYALQAEYSDDPAASYLELCSGLTDLVSDSTLDDIYFSFSVPVTDGQILQVVLALDDPDSASDSFYRITSWQVVNTEEWQPDTKQNLFVQPD
jgi:hypothetical protein